MPRGSYGSLVFQKADIAKDAITNEAKLKISHLYADWAKDIGKKAEYYKNKTTKSSWLQEMNMRQLQAQLAQQSLQIGNEVKGIIENSIYMVADSVVQANSNWLKDLGFPVNGVDSAFVSIPDQTVRRLVTGQIYDTGWSLSKSIWGDNEKTLSKLYEIVAQGSAQNMSVYDVSKILEAYVSPDRAKQWNLTMPDGKKIYKRSVDYNAQRLVRTLTQHGYQTSFIAVTEKNPFVKDYIWRANGSRVCELCMQRDGMHFKKDELPLDHPNGMCTMEPNVDDDKMIDQLADWINSPDGTFPEIDEFAKQFGYMPLVKESIKNNQAEKVQQITRDKEWCKKNCTSPKMQNGWGLEKNGRDVIASKLSQEFVPDSYKEAFSRASKRVKQYTNERGGSYYSQSTYNGNGLINISPGFTKDKFTNSHFTIFHEMGHAIDCLASRTGKTFSSVAKYGFQDAMVADILNIENKLANDKEGGFLWSIREAFTDPDSVGVQDAFSAFPHMYATEYKGFSKKKDEEKLVKIVSMLDKYQIRTRFSHSNDYWTRDDAVKECASELFANISAATVSNWEMDYMKEYFPKSVECFNKILEENFGK